MDARSAVAMLLVLALGGACSSNKLRAGHCERDSDCLPGESCVLQGAATFTCAPPDGGVPDLNNSEVRPDASPEAGPDVVPEAGPDVVPECTVNGECPSEKPICDVGACRACDVSKVGDGAACAGRDGARPVCGPNGSCVECTGATSADCNTDPARPICDLGSNMCVKCSADAECVAKGVGPGICMSHQDGRCAGDGEVIYVENKTGCASNTLVGMAGSAGAPFCGPQLAIDALTASRRLVIISGPVAGLQWNAAGATPVSIVGRANAALVGGLQSGISISGAGELFARDIVVRRSDAAGISALNAAVLRLNHVTVDANGGGGILVDGAAFEIRNTTITANGPGQSGAVTWGGILLTNPVPAGLGTIELVTIRNNNPVGLSCSAPVTGNGVFASGNTSVDIASTCGITSCSPAGPTCGAP